MGGCRWWINFIHQVELSFEGAFGSLARAVARHPKRTLVLACVPIVLSMAGFVAFEMELDVMEWLVDDSHWVRINADRSMQTWGKLQKTALMFAREDGTSTNMLDKAVLLELFDVVRAVNNVQTEVDTDGGGSRSMGAYCFRPFGVCMQLSVFTYYECFPAAAGGCVTAEYSDIIRARVEGSDPLAVIGRPGALSALGLPIDDSLILGGVERDAAGRVTSASALLETWLLEQSEGNAKAIKKVEKAVLKQLNTVRKEKKQGYEVGYLSEAVIDEVNVEAIFGNLDLIAVCFVVMALFVVVVMGGLPPVNSRVALACAVLSNVTMSLILAFSASFVLGFPVDGMSQVAFFVVLGMGVDGMILILHEFERAKDSFGTGDIEQRLSIAFAKNGRSVSLASATTSVLFLSNLTNKFPVMRGFSLVAAIALSVNVALMFTFFGSALVLDERRKEANRHDVCCCIVSKRRTKEAASLAAARDLAELEGEVEGEAASEDSASVTPPGSPGLLEKVFEAYSKRLTCIPVREGLLVFWLCVVAFSVYDAAHLKVTYNPTEFMPYDSAATVVLDGLADSYSIPATVDVLLGMTDYRDEWTQRALLTLEESLRAIPDVLTVSSWYPTFRVFAGSMNATNNGIVHPGSFDDLVLMWTQSPSFLPFADNIIIKRGKVVSARTVCTTKAFEGKKGSDTMRTMRQVCEDTGMPCFVHGEQLINSVIYDQTIFMLIINLTVPVGIVGLLVFLCVHPQVAALIVFNLLLVQVEVVGFIHLYGFKLTPPMNAVLSVALGLSVDYMIHIGHLHVSSPLIGSALRAQVALSQAGPAVLIGGVTTFLGMFVLMFGRSPVFLNFALTYVTIVVVGLIHGLALFPAMLSFVNAGGATPPSGGRGEGEDGGEWEEMATVVPPPDVQQTLRRGSTIH